MTTTTTVPAWQTKIRAAQAASEAIIDAINEKRAEEQRQRAVEHAGYLKRALACLGIDAEPFKNEWVQDEYRFYLPTYPSSDAVHFQEKEGRILFKLRIGRPDIHEINRQLDYQAAYSNLTEEVSTSGFFPEDRNDPVWKEVQAQVAYALDQLDERQESMAKELADQQSRTTPAMTQRFLTPAEELARLIGELVGNEVRNQLGHDDD